MTITTIIWDLGGVLVRTEDPKPRQELAELLNITRPELETLVFGGQADYRGQLGEIDSQSQWENVIHRTGRDLAELQRFRKQFFDGDRVDYPLVDWIRTLRGRYKTGLLSNAFSDLREIMTSKWQIADAFDTLVISAEEGLMKPDPRIYRLALSRLQTRPEQSVFIDDSLANIKGAVAVGMQAIHFQKPEQALRELNALLDGKSE